MTVLISNLPLSSSKSEKILWGKMSTQDCENCFHLRKAGLIHLFIHPPTITDDYKAPLATVTK